MTARRRWAFVAAGIVVVGAVGVLALGPGGDQGTATGLAPAFTTQDLGGGRVSLSDYRGRPVLVNFWASWCVPCRKEFPLLRDVHRGGGSGPVVLGVVFQDTRAAATGFMREQDADWPGLVDPGGRIARDYGVGLRPGLPVTVAIDRRGRLAGRHVGELRKGDLDRLVATAAR